jgi:hypothetical protein
VRSASNKLAEGCPVTGRSWLCWKAAMAARVLRPNRPLARPASKFSLANSCWISLIWVPVTDRSNAIVGRVAGTADGDIIAVSAGLACSGTATPAARLSRVRAVWAGARLASGAGLTDPVRGTIGSPMPGADCSLASACFAWSSPASAAIRYQPAAMRGLGAPNSPLS